MRYRTDCIFSPNDRMVLTGTSVKKEGDGKLLFLDRESLDTVSEITVAESVSPLQSVKGKLQISE